MSNIALCCADVGVQFGALKAVDGVSYNFHRGGVYGLIGPNGAGKTTLLNVLAGRLMRHSGSIVCEGVDITSMSPHQRARCGIGRSFQITKIFPDMTVLENLRIAAQIGHGRFLPFWLAPRYDRRLAQGIDAMLDLTGLTAHRDTVAGTLSYGLQRALELGVTLMPGPRILLLDEPLAGVGHHEIESSTNLIEVASVGRTVLLIEQNMDVVMRLSQGIVVHAQAEVPHEEHGWLANAGRRPQGRQFPEHDNVPPMAAYLGTADAWNSNGQIFHVAGGSVGVSHHPTAMRTLCKPAMWTLDELSKAVPELLEGTRNPAPPPVELEVPGRSIEVPL